MADGQRAVLVSVLHFCQPERSGGAAPCQLPPARAGRTPRGRFLRRFPREGGDLFFHLSARIGVFVLRGYRGPRSRHEHQERRGSGRAWTGCQSTGCRVAGESPIGFHHRAVGAAVSRAGRCRRRPTRQWVGGSFLGWWLSGKIKRGVAFLRGSRFTFPFPRTGDTRWRRSPLFSGTRRKPKRRQSSSLHFSRLARQAGDGAAERIAQRAAGIGEGCRVRALRAGLYGDDRRANGPFQPCDILRRERDDQAELDRYWNGLLGEAAQPRRAAGSRTGLAFRGKSSRPSLKR